LVWHKVDPEIVSNATNDCFLSPVMMTAVECFDLFCAKAQDKTTNVDPTKKTSLDFYYNDFKRKRETVAVKQSRLCSSRIASKSRRLCFAPRWDPGNAHG
ncbi:hypothetical protein E4U28_000786, partial [Claviceps purpurea]